MLHYRATKTTLLNVAKKATDYLYGFYKTASPALAPNAICPSHYMGVIEMYRTTKDPRYLELAKHLIAIKGKIEMEQMITKIEFLFYSKQKPLGTQ